jgi:hypothetical protein
MNIEQENSFWQAIETFDNEGLLPYIMLIGSWAEYIYSFYFETDFKPNLRTKDVDFLYRNINRPKNEIKIISALKEIGFYYAEHPISGASKFFKEDLLEIEFLTRIIGSGSKHIYEIPSLGIKAEGLRIINMLNNYPLELECKEFIITVPEPAAYLLQKLLTNPTRTPFVKREKDIYSVKELLFHIRQSKWNYGRLKPIFESLTKKEQSIILNTCEKNEIEIL